MGAKSIVVIGTLDTKGEQIRFVKKCIEQRGHNVIVMDLSMGGEPLFKADITPEEIARIGNADIRDIKKSSDRFKKTQTMEDGATKRMKVLLEEGEIDGVIAIGGVSMALMASHIMKPLPYGIPKLIICPAAMPAYIDKWFDTLDVAIMQMILEVAGMDSMIKNALSRAAGAICGMAEEVDVKARLHPPGKSVSITQFGYTENCAINVREYLEELGYHVYSFHAQGISDKAMDELIEQGFFDAVIEIVPAGVIEDLYQGNRRAGPNRLEAAGKRGIPQVIAPGAINITGCGPTRKNVERYISREKVVKLDELRALTRYNSEELIKAAKVYAEKLNKAVGPVKILIPLRGWSSVDKEGSILYDPYGDRVFVEEIEKYLKAEIGIEYVDCNLDDPIFARKLVDSLDIIMKQKRASVFETL
jgi:uncharacterized protein (UPF0261 family)